MNITEYVRIGNMLNEERFESLKSEERSDFLYNKMELDANCLEFENCKTAYAEAEKMLKEIKEKYIPDKKDSIVSQFFENMRVNYNLLKDFSLNKDEFNNYCRSVETFSSLSKFRMDTVKDKLASNIGYFRNHFIGTKEEKEITGFVNSVDKYIENIFPLNSEKIKNFMDKKDKNMQLAEVAVNGLIDKAKKDFDKNVAALIIDCQDNIQKCTEKFPANRLEAFDLGIKKCYLVAMRDEIDAVKNNLGLDKDKIEINAIKKLNQYFDHHSICDVIKNNSPYAFKVNHYAELCIEDLKKYADENIKPFKDYKFD